MENKKDLNIWLLVISLLSIITILLPFAKVLEIAEEAPLWVDIIFYGTTSTFIVCLIFVAVISLISLIRDNYRPIKFIEFLILLGFLMITINLICFACTEWKLTIGYAIFSLEAFIMMSFSQAGRLFSAFKSFGKDFISLFKDPNAPEKPKKEKKNKGINLTIDKDETIENKDFFNEIEEETMTPIVEKVIEEEPVETTAEPITDITEEKTEEEKKQEEIEKAFSKLPEEPKKKKSKKESK